jgi:hypothetical protein
VKKLLVLTLMVSCGFTTGTSASATAQKYVRLPRYRQEQRQPGEERRWLEERRRQEEDRRKQEEERRRREEERRKQEEDRRRQEEQRRHDEDRRRQEEEHRCREDDRHRQEKDRRHMEEDRRRQEEERHRHDGPPYPQPPHWQPHPRISGEQFRTKQVLRKTADVLIRAQWAARNGYGQGLGMAYTHQQQAWNLYYEGRYQRSIEHSVRARLIANEIIRRSQTGRRPGPGSPPYRLPHDRLDDELSIRIVDDNIAIRLKIDLD